MKTMTLSDLQVSVQDPTAFNTLGDYLMISQAYLNLIREGSTSQDWLRVKFDAHQFKA